MEFKKEFLDKLRCADKIVFFTGAGISAESGISTFRGADGLWSKLKPEELANFDAFLRNPDMVWEWYQYRRKIINESQPNAGHKAIADMQSAFESVIVSTQNIDNLHRRAGSKTVYELHGNIERNYCLNCGKKFDSKDFSYTGKAPLCDCGGRIRPDIVWFGEFLPEDEFAASEKAAADCDIMFVVGTSAVVYPAAQIPLVARSAGAYVVEVNMEETDLSRRANYSILGKSGEILPIIANMASQIRNKEVK
jgi:NAD-dependent deacetylase